MSDFISDFMAYTEAAITPPMFRRWSAISCVAGACERRVWAKVRKSYAFPNLYVLLVAPPGVGKSIVNTVRELWHEAKSPLTKTPAFRVAPDSITKAALVDRLQKSKQVFLPKSGPAYEYHSLQIAAEEFGVLLPGWDNEFIATLNAIYNNPSVPYVEERRHGPAREVSINNPNLNILGGVQPVWIGMTLPEEAWGMGLMTRMIMIYQGSRPRQDIFGECEDEDEGLRQKLLDRLGRISTLYGQMSWTQTAHDKIRNWHMGGELPLPTHSKLTYYNSRRPLHLVKLSTISSISRGDSLVIEEIDVTRAMEWLFEAEHLMPDIFRDMAGKSDYQVIEELHFYLTAVWAKNQSPIPESKLHNFLAPRCPSEKIAKIVEVAEKSNIISRFAGTTTFRPVPKHLHGME